MRNGAEQRVVLVGGGHAHIQVLERWAERPPAAVRPTLVVDRAIAVYSGMVPGFVAGQYEASELEIDAAEWGRRAGARVLLEPAIEIRPETHHVRLEGGGLVSYDVASFDIGSTVGGLDLPGVREHALPTRPIGRFVQRIDALVERASRRPAEAPFRVVIVGAGAGGVELAFALEARLREASPASVEILLAEAGPRILPRYPDSLVRRVHRNARERGITIRCGLRVEGAEPDRILVEGAGSLPCDGLIWVTGPVCQPIFEDSGVATDDRGFVRIRSTLQFEEHDDLFAVGDCGTLIEHPETPKAGVYAVREGPVIARNLERRTIGEPLETYEPQSDFLTLLNLGDGTALGTKWGFSFEGRWVMKLKDWIDRRFMARFQ